MRIVHHQNTAVLFGQIAQLVQRGNVPIHAKHAIADDEPTAEIGVFPQLRLEVGHIVVGIPHNFGPAQPTTINDAGVVQLVRKNHILFTHQGRNGGQIGREAALEGETRLGVLKFGQRLFQFVVQGDGSRDGAHSAGANAVFVNGIFSGRL